jgi:hypothetical protein
MEIEGEEWWQCPRRPILDQPDFWREIMSAYNHFRAGMFVDEGAVNDQSYRLMMLFRLLDIYFGETDEVKRIRAAQAAHH